MQTVMSFESLENEFNELQKSALMELRNKQEIREFNLLNTFIFPLHWELNKTRDNVWASEYAVIKRENGTHTFNLNSTPINVIYFSIGVQVFSNGALLKKSENKNVFEVLNPVSGTYMFVPSQNRIYRVTRTEKEIRTGEIKNKSMVGKLIQRVLYIDSGIDSRYQLNNLLNSNNVDRHIPNNQIVMVKSKKSANVDYIEFVMPDYANMTGEEISNL